MTPPPRQRHKLRTGLRAVGALGMLLAAANVAWNVWHNFDQGREALAETARRQAANISRQIGYEVMGAQVVLERFLAELRAHGPTGSRCSDVAALSLSNMKGYLNIGLVGPDGYIICSGVAVSGRLYVGDRPY
ncbi:MAG: hypothetical protein ACRDGM_09215, partial [bacterium]